MIIFFPTAGALDKNRWRVPVHGWVFRPTEVSRTRRSALRVVKHLLRRRIAADDPGMPNFEMRAGAFLADNLRGSRIEIEVGGSVFAMKRSRANGHFEGVMEVPAGAAADCAEGAGPSRMTFRAVRNVEVFEGHAMLVRPVGLSVISDIDDTIKLTEVLDRRKMLRNTFVRDFACIPEMAAVYRRWREQRQVAFHYVSASPWHLYPFLSEFLEREGFPEGTFHLRDFRLMPGELRKTLRPSRRVKMKHARELMERFPGRRFWLVGDSGEADAAMYARLAVRYPRQVERILIRNVTGEPAEHVRWGKVFRGLAPGLCQVFSEAAEIT